MKQGLAMLVLAWATVWCKHSKVYFFLQVQLVGNCKLATLLQKRKICTKHRDYNGLSLLLLERQITLYSLWCNKLVVALGLKLGLKTKVNLEVKLLIKL